MRGYLDAHDLPRHPLEAQGYRSIGCAPCTRPTAPGQDPREGRWAGRNKTECGIHLEHQPTKRDQPSDKDARVSKGLEFFSDPLRLEKALDHASNAAAPIAVSSQTRSHA
jgi:hypothetical protein